MTEAEQLRDTLQRLSRELGRPPELADILKREDCPDLPEFQDAFGSWYSALWAAGFTPQNPPSYWTEEDIIHALQALGDAPDDPPETDDLSGSTRLPSLSVIHDRFESWEDALEAAGFETPLNTRQWTEDQLIADLRDLGNSLGRKPKATDVAQEPEMAAPRTYDHVFGSWNAAVEAAGYTPTPVGNPREYSDEELIRELQSIAADLDRQPRMADVAEHDRSPSPSVFTGRFGTWANALAAADIETEFERAPQYSESELLDALRTLGERVERTPSIGDLEKYEDLPSPATYYRRFESFTDALELSGLTRGRN